MRAAYKFEPMARYNAQRKARAAAAEPVFDFTTQFSYQISGIVVSLMLMTSAALIGLSAPLWIAAMGAIGGVAVFSAIFGLVAHRATARLARLAWTAAIAAIDVVMLVAIAAQITWR